MRRLFVVLVMMWSSLLSAQEAPLVSFFEQTHDFGEIKEEAGAVQYNFRFLNRGDGPLTIENIQVPCGCTTSTWSEGLILPGDTGFVNVTFDPLNRPGVFQKTLLLQTNALDSISHLYITGKVKPKLSTLVNYLPTVMGNLRTRFKSFNLGVLSNEKVFTRSFDLYNQGSEKLIFLDSVISPDNVSVLIEPKELAPGQLGRLSLSYDPTSSDYLGFRSDKIVLYTDEGSDSEKEFNLLATVEEYFPEMSEDELNNAPRLVISEPKQEFTKVAQGELVTMEYLLENQGKTLLEIRRLDPNCDCVEATLEEMSIAPSQTQVLKVIFDTKGRRSNQIKMITIFSNDPLNSMQTVMLRGYVESLAE